MQPFALLLERLLYTPQRNVKQALLVDYFRHTADPDRGWGLAALTGSLTFRHAKPGLVRALVAARTDPVLFGWSYDFVGDLAETAALIWPVPAGDAMHPARPAAPRLAAVVTAMADAARSDLPDLVAGWLDRLDANGRWALLKLVTGALRVGASERLAKLALADYAGVDVALIEEVWHGQAPPYGELFAWLDGRGPRPVAGELPVFRSLMLAHPLETADLARLESELEAYLIEWKWDGIRVQVAATGGGVRLYSRSGDDITGTFPELTQGIAFTAVLDGELLVGQAGQEGSVSSFNALQQRLNRKTVSLALLEQNPAFIRLYDILVEGAEDLRGLPLSMRRQRLEQFFERQRPPRMDLSPLVPPASLPELDEARRAVRGSPREGLMLKRRDSLYLAGRPKGLWWKWKREVLLADCVLMYAQRGHGKRSSFYSDYTFGAWREAEGGVELVPVGKAYSGFTDEELKQLDKWVRDHTINRFGPVREVTAALVLEIAFDSLHRSTRHKSGIAMRFPRVSRIRWDKPAAEADRLDGLWRLLA